MRALLDRFGPYGGIVLVLGAWGVSTAFVWTYSIGFANGRRSLLQAAGEAAYLARAGAHGAASA